MKKSKNDSPLLDKIEFSFQEAETHKTFHLPIDKNKYALFYTTVVNDKSLTEVPTEITAAFNQTPYASLTIMVQNQNYKNASDKNQLFQELQLLYKGDYYRLKLRDATGTNWIYFYHPRIYENALTLLRA
ncbi:MAG: hypothetical protein HWD61_03870 [Parachlamydiaceae bacterium]|nr:MAG: hypothetical protein HWD61_03870 [Parachlamydiaceae bacterium]